MGNSENKWNIYANNLTATTINSKAPVSGVKGNSESSYRTGDVNITAANIGLGNVENKSSATIRGELTKANVTTALGYTPPTTNTDTHRVIQVNGTQALASNTTALNLKAGSNITITDGGSGAITIAATDTNTWRGIQNNLTSDSTTDSLSAYQGKVLKGLVDGKAASGHTHTTSIATSTGTNQLTLAANTKYAITAGGTSYIFTTPPDSNTWRPVSDSVSSTSSSDAASSKAVKTAYDLAASKTANTGTVTSIATGVGLTGGTITGSGTLKAKLRSETALTIDSAAATTTSGRVYPVAVDKTGYLAVNVPWTDNNTWRGIQDNLTSSSTSDSLSANQGRLLKNAVDKCEVLVLSKTGLNTLSYTFENSAIETDMVCIKAELSNPAAQTSDWTVDTGTAGRATISGSINGSTDIKIYLMKSR